MPLDIIARAGFNTKNLMETIEAVKRIPGVRGIHIMPVLWESVVPELLKEAGLV